MFPELNTIPVDVLCTKRGKAGGRHFFDFEVSGKGRHATTNAL